MTAAGRGRLSSWRGPRTASCRSGGGAAGTARSRSHETSAFRKTSDASGSQSAARTPCGSVGHVKHIYKNFVPTVHNYSCTMYFVRAIHLQTRKPANHSKCQTGKQFKGCRSKCKHHKNDQTASVLKYFTTIMLSYGPFTFLFRMQWNTKMKRPWRELQMVKR